MSFSFHCVPAFSIQSPGKYSNGTLKPFTINYQDPVGSIVGYVIGTSGGKNPVYSLIDVLDELPTEYKERKKNASKHPTSF